MKRIAALALLTLALAAPAGATTSPALTLVVDRSHSMEGRSLADAIEAANAFLAAKTAEHVDVIAFGHRATVVSGLDPLRSLTADPTEGTALWDAITLAAQRQAGGTIFVVSDGRDLSSVASQDDATAAVSKTGARVDAIAIAGTDFAPSGLAQLAASSGGEYRELSATADTSEFAALGRALATPSAAWWTTNLGALAVAGAVGLLVLLACGFAVAARSGIWLRGRLEPHLGTTKRTDRRRRDARRELFRSFVTATERTFANVKQFRSLQRQLERADLPLRAAELLYVCVGVGIALALFATVASGSPLLVLVFLAFGAWLPVLFVRLKARARVKLFDNQLPDLLITIAASLKAGHSFRHAIQAVVDEGAEPASKEFNRVLTETRLGRPMDEALSEMAERVGSKNLSFVITAVSIQRQIGGSLAGLFDTVAETVRDRQQFARKIRGLTAMGRMSAYVLIGLPFFIAIALTAMNSAYMSPLWTTPTGHKLVGLALTMMVFGTVMLKKIVSFRA